MMSGNSKNNYMVNMVMNTVKSGATKDLFHYCPFSGIFILRNVTMKGDVLFSIYPSGIYRFFFKIFDEVDDQILLVKLSYDLKNWKLQ